MACPDPAVIMNYSLGREVSRDDRTHIARCKKCRKKLARLEDTVLAEGLEMQDQASYGFQIGAPRTETREIS